MSNCEFDPCELCGQDRPGRRHWLMATFANGAALYASLCTPCYRACLAALDRGDPAPRPRAVRPERSEPKGRLDGADPTRP
jgi:hypothetical protein